MMRYLYLLCAVVLSAPTLYACRSAPMTYYTLTPIDRSPTAAQSTPPAMQAILVLHSLPTGIDTTQILIRTDDTRLQVEEGGRWAAPLSEELRSALIDALRHQYGIVVLDNPRHNDKPVPRIDLTVRKFDIVAGSTVTLAVDWMLSDRSHEPNSTLSCQAEFHATATATATAAATAPVTGAVAAGQAAVLKLSHALGAALQASLSGTSPQCTES